MNVWKFIDKRSSATRVKDQLHAIWYLYCPFFTTVMAKLFIGTAYPWTVLVLFCLQSLNFLPKVLGKVSPAANYIFG